MADNQERRENIRVSKSIEVSYRTVTSFMKSGSRSIDISKGGIRLVAYHSLNPNTVIELEIRLLEFQRPIKVRGMVLWVNHTEGKHYPFEIGIKFTEIDPRDIEVINGICEKLAQDGSDKMGWLGKKPTGS